VREADSVHPVLVEPAEPHHRLIFVVGRRILAANRQQQKRGVVGFGRHSYLARTCQQKPKQPRRLGCSPGALPGMAESLPGTGFGTGATLIGALVTSTLGFCAGVGSV
jgi:hypothetical protein